MNWLNIDKSTNLPLTKQIYLQIRDFILNGKLAAGERLSSTRELAQSLAVSRNVVLDAYDQLMAEGYIVSRQGSGTIVADGAYFKCNETTESLSLDIAASDNKNFADMIDFRSGVPALDAFPLKKWGQLFHQICLELPCSSLDYSRPEGMPELRQELTNYLLRTRGIECAPEQIIITTGATQALALISQILSHPYQTAVVEDPLNYGMKKVFLTCDYKLLPVPVDKHGLYTKLLPQDAHPSFIYVTPSHQFPLGAILPIQRRIELIKYATDKNCYIIEDDYDSEIRYEGYPVSSLQSLEPEKVIYIGSFSKILAPALRLGYIILPPALLEPGRKLKNFTDVHTPSLEQLVLARFIKERMLERHIAKLRKTYAKRRAVLIKALETYFSGRFALSGDIAGLHIVVQFPGIEFTDPIMNAAELAGIRIYPVEKHSIQKGRHKDRIILGYGHLDELVIQDGIGRLKEVLTKNRIEGH